MLADLGPSVASDVTASLLLGGLGGGVLWARKQLKGLSQMTRDWNGVAARPGVADGTPGVMERLYSQDRQFAEVMDHLGRQDSTLEQIKHEVNYNSGSSIKDAVHRTDDGLKQVQADIDAIKSRLEA
jgi:hypothetical protein